MRLQEEFSCNSKGWSGLGSPNHTPSYVNGLATYAWADTRLTQRRSPPVLALPAVAGRH